MKGTLTLLFHEEVVSVFGYTSKYRRDEIINNWKKQYGKGFEKTRVEDTMQVLQNVARRKISKYRGLVSISAETIEEIVVKHFNVTHEDILTRRNNPNSLIRWTSMYFIHHYTTLTHKSIGAMYGMTESAVTIAMKRIRVMEKAESPEMEDVERINRKIEDVISTLFE